MEELKAHIEANFKPGYWQLCHLEGHSSPLKSIGFLGDFIVLKCGDEEEIAFTTIVAATRVRFLYDSSGSVRVDIV